MSLRILDTDTFTLLREGNPKVSARIASFPIRELAITVITVEEQLTGWYTLLRQARRPDQLARAYLRLAESVVGLASLPILAFPERAIARYSRLQGLKLNIGKMDLRIAAIALEEGAIVVTRNVRDFQRVPGLTVEDWTQ